jgi:hypothetical protein
MMAFGEGLGLIISASTTVSGLGLSRVVWRYGPIILSDITPLEYHVQRFAEVAKALEGSTMRVVVSCSYWWGFLYASGAARRTSQYVDTPMIVAPSNIMKIASSSLFALAPARARKT